MIDNPEQAEGLLTGSQAALPVPARMTPELAATLRTPDAAMATPAACSVIAVHYAGDEGGIVCGLDVVTANKAVYASITHCDSIRACLCRATSPPAKSTG